MLLNFRKLGSGPAIFVLHGVFGSSDNWQSIGKELSDAFTVYLIDLRNHGNSPHSDEMNYDVMAEDIRDLAVAERVKKFHLLGHSMGGKAAMNFASRFPNLIDKLVVVDIGPKYYAPHHQQIFRGFNAIDLKTLNNRNEAEEVMSHEIPDFGVRQFILKNLKRTDVGFAWKINLPVLEKNIEKVGEAIGIDKPVQVPTLFIRGAKSNYIQEEDMTSINEMFPNAKLITVEGAGHWVHAEKPKELLSVLFDFLKA
ncbi:MAG: esterase [Marinoscillum sp.]|jgi:esterase